MQHVKKYAPSVPVPKVYLTDFRLSWRGRIFMEEIPGENLEIVWPSLDASQKTRACEEIWRIIAALREISRPEDIPPIYTTIDGSPTPHHGLLGDYVYPVSGDVLQDEDAFRDFMIHRLRMNNCRDEDLMHNFPRSEAAVFTHGDLKPKNIMASADGKITALVDWEFAGFMPDYWEAAGMFMVVWEWEKDWAETMQRTRPVDWNFDIARIRKAEQAVRFGY